MLWHVLHLTMKTLVEIESQVAVFYKEAKKKKGTEKLNLRKINSLMVNQSWIMDFPPLLLVVWKNWWGLSMNRGKDAGVITHCPG